MLIKKYAILCAVCLGTMLSAYVSSCVNIALPNIMAALNFNMDSIVWVSLGYMLPYGSTLPLTGKLGDQYGAKNVYLGGLTLFTAASMFCGLANNATTLILFRIAQGVGAGMLLPNAMAIVAETFGAHERGQALGLWSAMAAAGSAMGPTIGGYLIESFDWRSVFFSVLPFCILSIFFAMLIIPHAHSRGARKLDWWGASFMILCISTLLVALNQGQKEGWSSLYILLLFYASFASFVLFIAVEFKVEEPMVDMYLFRNVNFSIANIVGFLSFMAFYSGYFLLPFFLKSILDYSSTTAGVMLLPMTASMLIFSPLGGRLADRFGSRVPAVSGILLIAAALYSLSSINSDFAARDFFIRLTAFGIGLGLTMSPLTNCAVSALPKNKVGVGSGIFNLFKIIGGSIGVVFSETLLTRREIYHTEVLKEYLSPALKGNTEVFELLRVLWGKQGMDLAMLQKAAHGWVTGNGELPGQYAMLIGLLERMVAKKAAILSFQDVFYTVAALCFIGAFAAMFIRKNIHGVEKAAR